MKGEHAMIPMTPRGAQHIAWLCGPSCSSPWRQDNLPRSPGTCFFKNICNKSLVTTAVLGYSKCSEPRIAMEMCFVGVQVSCNARESQTTPKLPLHGLKVLASAARMRTHTRLPLACKSTDSKKIPNACQ